MKKTMYVVTLCTVLGSFPMGLQGQSSSGNAVSTPATQVQQPEIVIAQKRLSQLQGELQKSSSNATRYGSSRRGTGYGRSGQMRSTTVLSNPWIGPSSSPHAGDTLIVPAQGAGPDDVLNAQDDLQVMSRLMQKQLEQAGIAQPKTETPFVLYNAVGAYGHNFSLSAVQSLYLSGYGAVFQMQVDFPLVPFAQAQNDQTGSQEDSLWAQTRLELKDPEAARRAKDKGQEAPPSYDPEKIEELKETLTKTLKYTRNIRALQPKEKVVIVITSTADPGDATHMPYYTTLVMNAGKADIDQFAGGNLSYEQFQGQVKSMMY